MFGSLKAVVARLPEHWQNELRRVHYRRQIGNGSFRTDELEYAQLESFVVPGDWVLDIGANVGHYTQRLSELVGLEGRVLAFEPVPATFRLLAANSGSFRYQNVSLFNVAASDRFDLVGMSIPKFANGLANHFEAHLSTAPAPDTSVIALPLDSLALSKPISFIKIDAEGHEESVLAGMWKLIEAARPVMVVETRSLAVEQSIVAVGYTAERWQDSPNVVFRPVAAVNS